MGFLPHFHPPPSPHLILQQPRGRRSREPAKKHLFLMRVSGSRAALPPQGMGCFCLNEGDLWKIPSHNRQIFQASLAALV